MTAQGRAEALDRWARNWEISDTLKPLYAAFEEACDKYGELSKQARAIERQITELEAKRL